MTFNTPILEIPTAQIGVEFDVPKERAIFQASAFSMGLNGQIGAEYYLKNNGISFLSIKNNDNEITSPGVISKNNHPSGGSIVVSSGNVELAYKNTSKLGKSIVLGLGEIKSDRIENLSYRFYGYQGLKTTPYYTQVDAGETAFLAIPIERKDTFGYVQEAQAGTLHKKFNANLIVDGKLWLGEMEWSNNGAQWYNFDGKELAINQTHNLKLRPKGDGSKYVSIQVTTFGGGETGRVKVLEVNGVNISFNHVRISTYVFNYNYGFEHPTWPKYNALEAGDIYYKMFNNEGKVDSNKMEIVQGATSEKVDTLSIKNIFSSGKNSFTIIIPIGLILLVIYWKQIKKLFK